MEIICTSRTGRSRRSVRSEASLSTYHYKTGQVVAEELLLDAPRRMNARQHVSKPALNLHKEKPVRCQFAPIAK